MWGEGKMGRDEQILVLEEMVCLFEKAMEGLKSAYEASEDENQKLKLKGGILVFEFVINIMRKEIDNWRIMEWVLIGVIIVRSM